MSATASRGRAPSPAAPLRAAVATLGMSFKATTAAVRRLRGRDTHRPGGLNYAQYSLLFGLAERGELSASELAGLAEVAPPTATQMLDGLVAGGFVERSRSERDRRIVLVSLTERGAQLVAARRAHYEELWARALAGFSDAELATATAVLDSVRTIFDELLAEPEAC